jgi:hypothetical protein
LRVAPHRFEIGSSQPNNLIAQIGACVHPVLCGKRGRRQAYLAKQNHGQKAEKTLHEISSHAMSNPS